MISNISAVARHLEDTVRKHLDIAVVGISGGVDSSVVAAISVAALGKENVHLLSMPYDDTDTKTFNARSLELAEKLGAIHHIINIQAACKPIEVALLSAFKGSLDRLTLGNIRPRIRMTLLYGFSGELGFKTGKKARVMGTGHLSEDLVGYDTKGGDALCDLFILSDLLKSEVYQLAHYYNIPESIIKAEPSAGLYPNQTDADELGYTYAELEASTLALFNAIKRGVPDSDLLSCLPEFNGIDPVKVKFVLKRFLANAHKHRAPMTVDIRRAEWFK